MTPSRSLLLLALVASASAQNPIVASIATNIADGILAAKTDDAQSLADASSSVWAVMGIVTNNPGISSLFNQALPVIAGGLNSDNFPVLLSQAQATLAEFASGTDFPKVSSGFLALSAVNIPQALENISGNLANVWAIVTPGLPTLTPQFSSEWNAATAQVLGLGQALGVLPGAGATAAGSASASASGSATATAASSDASATASDASASAAASSDASATAAASDASSAAASNASAASSADGSASAAASDASSAVSGSAAASSASSAASAASSTAASSGSASASSGSAGNVTSPNVTVSSGTAAGTSATAAANAAPELLAASFNARLAAGVVIAAGCVALL